MSAEPVIVEGELALGTVTVAARLEVGSRDELPRDSGSAHLLEHLVMSSPPAGEDGSISEWVDRRGGQSNASTNKESIVFWVRVQAADAAEAARRLLTAVRHAEVAGDRWAGEVRAVEQELIASAADPGDDVHERLFASLFGTHPLAAPVGGRLGNVPSLRPGRVAALRAAWLAERPLKVAVVGGAAARREAVAAAREILAEPPRPPAGSVTVGGGAWSVPRTPPPAPRARADLDVDAGADYAFLGFGALGACRSDPGWPGMEVAANLLGGNPASLMYRGLRTDGGLAYQILGWHADHSDSGVWRLLVGCEPREAGVVARAVTGVLDTAASGAFGGDDCDAARAQAIGETMIECEDPVSLAYMLLKRAATGDVDLPRCDVDALAKVSRDDLVAAAGTLRDGLNVVVCPPAGGGER